jgi:hypothetical protein
VTFDTNCQQPHHRSVLIQLNSSDYRELESRKEEQHEVRDGRRMPKPLYKGLEDPREGSREYMGGSKLEKQDELRNLIPPAFLVTVSLCSVPLATWAVWAIWAHIPNTCARGGDTDARVITLIALRHQGGEPLRRTTFAPLVLCCVRGSARAPRHHGLHRQCEGSPGLRLHLCPAFTDDQLGSRRSHSMVGSRSVSSFVQHTRQ